ncbi:MAG: type II toxin-antitoxin system VapC family toxin [Acetobacteraceae bacterium]
MLLLDTNVVSAMLGVSREPRVRACLAEQHDPLLVTASVCQAELWAGIATMPEGRRRQLLEQAVHTIFAEEFYERVLPFDEPAAFAYADIFAARRRAGRPGATTDLMIAAIARVHGARVVTRNVRDFEGCGVPVTNPWDP